MFVFRHKSRAVALSPPTNQTDVAPLLLAAAGVSPTSERVVTLPRLRVACYRSDADNFRWSMTSDEDRWHTFCLATSKMVRLGSNGHVEFFHSHDIDALIHFRGTDAFFEWECTDSSWGGQMYFTDNDQDNEVDWMRLVAQSVRLRNSDVR